VEIMVQRKSAPRISGARQMNASLKSLVESITESVTASLEQRFPRREELREIERSVRELSRKVDALASRPGVRRVGRPRSDRQCEIQGCAAPHVAQGYCSKHYQAWRRSKLAEESG
jgi:hypothetical protein